MLLLSGPPGSGKTHRILDEVRGSLVRGATDFRLVVPTARMAERLRNKLALEGCLVRPGLIQTLARFISPYIQDYPEIGAASLGVLVDRVLKRDAPAAFSAVKELPGFRASLTRLILELSGAGCEARRLSRVLEAVTAEAPLAPAFLAVYEEIEKLLLRRGWALRAARLRCAGDEIRAHGLPRIHHVLFDGFPTFTDPELGLIEAIRSHADVTATLPAWSGAEPARDALLGLGMREELLETCARPRPQAVVVTASSQEQEAEEIARRILGCGRPFSEIGVILRSREPYAPLLRATLERFGIPARFSFGEPLAAQAPVRLLTGAVEAMRSGWDHGRVLDLLRMAASGLGGTSAGDRFDVAVREHLPGRGLDGLRALSDHPRVGALLDRLGSLEAWRAQRALPADWAARARTLRCLCQPPLSGDGVPHETAARWRSHAAALEAFDEAMEEAAAVVPAHEPAPFSVFWAAAEAVLRDTPFVSADRRRNVVRVMDVREAASFELPVVFVCGLLEKRFPRYPAADAILGEAARATLERLGFRILTAARHRQQEEFLFEMAASRATATLVLSYPELNAKGEPNLPSFFLERVAEAPRQAAPPVELRRGAPAAEPRPVYLRDPALVDIVRRRHAALAPTAIEDFLQCPFQFFLRHTLKLEEPPAAPNERLGPPLEGRIVHQVLAEVERGAEQLEAVFDLAFEEACRDERVPPGCRTELARLNMLRDLRRFLAGVRRLPGWTTRSEQKIRYALDAGVEIDGRIDRFDLSGDGRAVVFDFKYSSAEGIRRRIRGYREGKAVQGALYLLGLAERHGYVPAGFFYWGLRGAVALDGWHTELPGFETIGVAETPEDLRSRLAAARETALRAAAEIHRGRVEPSPLDRDRCEFCVYGDACRLAAAAGAAAASGQTP